MYDLQATEISELLGSPKIFQSSITGNITYHVSRHEGKFNVTLYEGRLLPSDFSQLLNQAAKFDITREVYERTQLNGDIKQTQIITDLDMTSRLTHLHSKQAKADIKQQNIDAKIAVDMLGFQLPVHISGNLKQPDITTELGKELRNQAEQALEKEKRKVTEQWQQEIKKTLPALPFGR